MSTQLSAILLLGLLACTCQSARMISVSEIASSHVFNGSEADDTSFSSTSKCSELEAKIRRLCDYLPSKVTKLETKGISGWKGTQRIIILGRKANSLAASIKAFEVEKCNGDLTTAKEHVASVTTQIKQLAVDGGETTAKLANAISECEDRMAAEMAKPKEEQDFGAIQAAFMLSLLGSDGEMTDMEKNKLVCKEGTCETDQIVNDILSEPDTNHLSANETESLKRLEQENSLVDISNTKEVATSGNIFLDCLVPLTQFVVAIVMGILGLVYLIAFAAVAITHKGVMLLSYMAASMACAMWWFMGQFVEFVSWGWMRFGGDSTKCIDTIWRTPFLKPTQKGLKAFWNHQPWFYMSKVDLEIVLAKEYFELNQIKAPHFGKS